MLEVSALRMRFVMGIALFCGATSIAKADEFTAQFFLNEHPTPTVASAPAPTGAGGKLASIASGPVGSTRASWYGGGEHLARRMASGEIFHPDALTAAHRSLPLGTRLIVSANGRSVMVRVNDRGPAKWTGRSLDLSRGAARALGMIGSGTARVSYRVAGL